MHADQRAHPFATLEGTWRGRGEGSYPTIEPFAYTEELIIEVVPGRPVAHWRSRTRDAATSEPRHAESGFLRAAARDDAPDNVELVVAHSFGIVETTSGSLEGGVLELASDALASSPTAKRVASVVRHYSFEGEGLSYSIAMAAVDQPLTHHLAANLRRDAGS